VQIKLVSELKSTLSGNFHNQVNLFSECQVSCSKYWQRFQCRTCNVQLQNIASYTAYICDP